MIILVTGSRDWEDRDVINADLDQLWDLASGRLTVMHGWCPTGADKIADDWATSRHGVTLRRFAADWTGPCRPECRPGHRRRVRNAPSYCPAAGAYRNQVMVDRRPDQVRAYQLNHSRGTQDCIDRARAAGLTVVLQETA